MVPIQILRTHALVLGLVRGRGTDLALERNLHRRQSTWVDLDYHIKVNEGDEMTSIYYLNLSIEVLQRCMIP